MAAWVLARNMPEFLSRAPAPLYRQGGQYFVEIRIIFAKLAMLAGG
jgi:hypothetical protein